MFCPHRVKIALATAPPLPQNPNKIRGMVDILIVFVLQDTSNHSRNFKPHGLADMQCVSGFFFFIDSANEECLRRDCMAK